MMEERVGEAGETDRQGERGREGEEEKKMKN